MHRTNCVRAGSRLDPHGPEIAALIRALDPRAWLFAGGDAQLLADVAQIRGILLRSASGHDLVTTADLDALRAMAGRRDPLGSPELQEASGAVANAARLATAVIPRPDVRRRGGAPRWFARAARSAG